MRGLVGGEGVGQVGAEGVFVCFACIAVQPGRDVQRDFEAVGLVQQAADGGGCFGQCAAETCPENAFDNEVVTCFQSAKPAYGTTFQFIGADKADAVRMIQPLAIQLRQRRQFVSQDEDDIYTPAPTTRAR